MGREQIKINGQTWSERELAQIIRRKMMSKTYKSPKNYTRKVKHKNDIFTKKIN